jgi:hypothetical protein
MKTVGMILIIGGIMLTMFSAFYTVRHMVPSMRKNTVTTEYMPRWSPFMGLATMVVGGVIMGIGMKRGE